MDESKKILSYDEFREKTRRGIVPSEATPQEGTQGSVIEKMQDLPAEIDVKEGGIYVIYDDFFRKYNPKFGEEDESLLGNKGERRPYLCVHVDDKICYMVYMTSQTRQARIEEAKNKVGEKYNKRVEMPNGESTVFVCNNFFPVLKKHIKDIWHSNSEFYLSTEDFKEIKKVAGHWRGAAQGGKHSSNALEIEKTLRDGCFDIKLGRAYLVEKKYFEKSGKYWLVRNGEFMSLYCVGKTENGVYYMAEAKLSNEDNIQKLRNSRFHFKTFNGEREIYLNLANVYPVVPSDIKSEERRNFEHIGISAEDVVALQPKRRETLVKIRGGILKGDYDFFGLEKRALEQAQVANELKRPSM